MFIKSINNVVGYKDLPDGFNANFSEDINYIIGANFQRKTTVGSLFNWCLTGTSLYGKEKEEVRNDQKKIRHVIVDITFVDNYGIEHRLIRNKGKEINLILDGKEIEQDKLSEFYKDKDIFLVAHNPYYFYSLEPKEQKDLLRKIVPSIEPEDAFELLSEEEQAIIGSPIEFLNSYTDKRNEEINELEKEYNKNSGTMQAYEKMALIQEGELLYFNKEQELKELQEKYEVLSINLGSSNLEDLQRSIDKINERLNEIFKIKLADITKQYNAENEKLQSIEGEIPICHACRQEIKNNGTKKHLKKIYEKELDKLQKKADSLREDATNLINERSSKMEVFEELNTSDMRKLDKEKREIKDKIDILQEEKNHILLHNKEVQIKQEQVREAKNNIEILKKVQKEILDALETSKIQKKIANKLKILVIERQQETINKYLNKVNIQFSRVNKTNDKIIECCDIQYEGRDYKKLSKSQQARACLEISNVFNNLSGIKTTIFFDDAETTTDIDEMKNTQMVISIVIKYNPLEILYDYQDVLDRKKKSLEKEIAEKSKYLEQAA